MAKKIIILEDEPVLANLYKKSLEKAGFEVFHAETISEIKEILTKLTPDLAIIDHGIKGEEESGIEFVPKLKKITPKTKIVMLSNYSHYQIREEAKKAGVDDFLVKLNTPPHELVEYVKKLFR
jgi:DNA-binding response OmpR family regulator